MGKGYLWGVELRTFGRWRWAFGGRTIGSHEVKRIQTILKGSKGQSMYSVSKEIGLGIDPTYKWRKRWEIAAQDVSSTLAKLCYWSRLTAETFGYWLP